MFYGIIFASFIYGIISLAVSAEDSQFYYDRIRSSFRKRYPPLEGCWKSSEPWLLSFFVWTTYYILRLILGFTWPLRVLRAIVKAIYNQNYIEMIKNYFGILCDTFLRKE